MSFIYHSVCELYIRKWGLRTINYEEVGVNSRAQTLTTDCIAHVYVMEIVKSSFDIRLNWV